MSSIATITDPSMLEFHRFRGSDSMVFWRLGLRKFSKFDVGDLVFFIDRRHRHPYTQEKGIIGFGRCFSISNKPLHKAWQIYEQKLGYDNEDHFQEAIRYYRKDDDLLPKKIQCIELEHIVLLQYPIFLSEVGFEMSERLESFTYLEKGKRDITPDVLNLAKNMGIDPWFDMQNKNISMDRFETFSQEQAIRKLLSFLPKIVTLKDANIIKKYTTGVYFEGVFYSFESKKLSLFYTNINDIATLYAIYGIQTYLESVLSDYQIESILYLKNPSKTIQQVLQDLNLSHVEI